MVTTRLLVVVLLVCAGWGLGAQTSLTSSTTGANFTTNTDKYLSVTDWSEVKSGLFYSGVASSSSAELGYGTSLGGLYLGSYYQGNLAGMASAPAIRTTISTADILANSVVTGKTVTTGTTVLLNTPLDDFNNAGLLVGFGPLGLSLKILKSNSTTEDRYQVDTLHGTLTSSVSTAGWTTLTAPGAGGADASTVTFAADGTKTANQDIAFTGGKLVTGTLTPTLSVGYVLPLGGLTLKPTVSGAYRLTAGSLSQAYSDVLQSLGSGYPARDTVTEVAKSTKVSMAKNEGYGTLLTSAGLLAEMNLKDSQLTFGGNYQLNLNLYGNSYTDALGTAATVAGTSFDLQGTTYQRTAASTIETVLRAAQYTTYTTSLMHSGSASAKFAASLGSSVRFATTAYASASLENYVYHTNGALVSTATTTSNSDTSIVTVDKYTKSNNGVQTDASIFSVFPSVLTGLQYGVVPDKLNLNLGLTWSLPGYYYKLVKTTNTGFDSVAHVTTVNGQKTVDTYSSTLGSAATDIQSFGSRWYGMSSTISAGMNLNLGEGVSFDMAFSGGTSIGLSTVSLQLQISK